MANKGVFAIQKPGPVAKMTTNHAGGQAYEMTDKHALAQIAATNCFNDTYYATEEDNFNLAKELVVKLKGDPRFIAQTAIYCREQGRMKDMAAFLTAYLMHIESEFFRPVFRRVIDNGKMLCTFVQIARSDAFGKPRNISSGAARHAIRDWFRDRTAKEILNATVGNDPSIKDILKMAHPKPETDEKAKLYAYILGYEDKYELKELPEIVRQYEKYKKNREGQIPQLDFRLLDGLQLTNEEWAGVAINAGWTTTRMNLNTFARHGVFKDHYNETVIANKLRNAEQVVKSRVYPYQLMQAWLATSDNSEIPKSIKNALQDAMEISTGNVPGINGRLLICVDSSQSMDAAVTGYKKGATSKANCRDVAAMFAAAIVRKNANADVILFDTKAYPIKFNPRDSIVTNTALFNKRGGGTKCQCALINANERGIRADVVIFISDYESWKGMGHNATPMYAEWLKFKRNNPKAKLVCIDLTPRKEHQIKDNKDILSVGGFSDTVFDVIASFLEEGGKNHWVDIIEQVQI